jgi:phage shock protein PspC (stress-responsive transcriptional regulator)
MTCQRCARDIDSDSQYCRFCGAAVHPGDERRRLTRLSGEGKVAGVCAGLAAYFGMDVTVVRLAWVILSIVPGAIIGGVLAYVIAWVLIPDDIPAAPRLAAGPRLTRSTTDRRIAGVCGGIAAYVGVDSTAVRVAWVILSIYPGAIICGVIAYAIAWLVIPGAAAPRLDPSPSTP